MSSSQVEQSQWEPLVRSSLPLGIILEMPLQLELTKETEAALRKPLQQSQVLSQQPQQSPPNGPGAIAEEPRVVPLSPRDEPTVDPQPRRPPTPTATLKTDPLIDQVTTLAMLVLGTGLLIVVRSDFANCLPILTPSCVTTLPLPPGVHGDSR